MYSTAALPIAVDMEGTAGKENFKRNISRNSRNSSFICTMIQ